jgi:hypothetical protein
VIKMSVEVGMTSPKTPNFVAAFRVKNPIEERRGLGRTVEFQTLYYTRLILQINTVLQSLFRFFAVQRSTRMKSLVPVVSIQRWLQCNIVIAGTTNYVLKTGITIMRIQISDRSYFSALAKVPGGSTTSRCLAWVCITHAHNPILEAFPKPRWNPWDLTTRL